MYCNGKLNIHSATALFTHTYTIINWIFICRNDLSLNCTMYPRFSKTATTSMIILILVTHLEKVDLLCPLMRTSAGDLWGVAGGAGSELVSVTPPKCPPDDDCSVPVPGRGPWLQVDSNNLEDLQVDEDRPDLPIAKLEATNRPMVVGRRVRASSHALPPPYAFHGIWISATLPRLHHFQLKTIAAE